MNLISEVMTHFECMYRFYLRISVHLVKQSATFETSLVYSAVLCLLDEEKSLVFTSYVMQVVPSSRNSMVQPSILPCSTHPHVRGVSVYYLLLRNYSPDPLHSRSCCILLACRTQYFWYYSTALTLEEVAK